MSDGLRAILDGRRGDVTAAEFEEWRALTLRLRTAMADLFEQCAMPHKHWGDGCNSRQADAAIKEGQAALIAAGLDSV